MVAITHDDFQRDQRQHTDYFEKRLVAQNLEHAAARLAFTFDDLSATADQFGFEDLKDWFDAGKCAALAAAKAAGEVKP